jgi:hypothetical protein
LKQAQELLRVQRKAEGLDVGTTSVEAEIHTGGGGGGDARRQKARDKTGHASDSHHSASAVDSEVDEREMSRSKNRRNRRKSARLVGLEAMVERAEQAALDAAKMTWEVSHCCCENCWVYMYVYVWVYMVCGCIFTYVHVCVCVCICVYVHACVCVQ